MPNSLRIRLVLAWSVFVAVILGAAYIGLELLFERSITRRTERELSADMRQLERGMEIGRDGAIRIARAPTDPQFDMLHAGRYWQISHDGRVILRSPSLGEETLPIPQSASPEAPARPLWITGPRAQRLYAVVRRYAVPSTPEQGADRHLVIITAVDGAEIREDTGKFASDLRLSLAGLALLLLAGVFAQVTVGLMPLHRVRASVAAVREGRRRRVDGAFPDEVMPLVDETNALLETQEGAIGLARQRAGDLAHGLKTPLAVMGAKSRQLRQFGLVDISDSIDAQINAMGRHIDRELARSRAMGASRLALARTDIAGLLRELVSALQALPSDRAIEWTVRLPERMESAVAADDIMNIAGNLLENAAKWAQGHITLAAEQGAHGVIIHVADDGPGIPEAEVDRVLLRGVRADTRVPGSGLGLAIVNDLVTAYNGTLTLTKGPLGGLSVTVELPDAGS